MCLRLKDYWSVLEFVNNQHSNSQDTGLSNLKDYDSFDSEDNVVLSILLQHKAGHPTDSSPTPPKLTQVPYCPSHVTLPPQEEETLVPEESSTSTEELIFSSDNKTLELMSTEGSGESSIPMSPLGHVEEGAHKWKCVVRWRIADRANISDQFNSCPAILDLICNTDLLSYSF
ncbi:putative mitochondrial protein [Cucumis melo var. makuwa]|uniref:Putative mitochondrial protein n=1 Tax=Cucumis melo var. makuwa TaxID=1194695 RepID=A0A5D3CGP3_CUCMM|nr:putative mitochondrial protein [Cucumis melo var. makuwa]